MLMVRLPVFVGSDPSSAPDSPLKSFPWMRFVEDIVEGEAWFAHDFWWEKRRKRLEAS